MLQALSGGSVGLSSKVDGIWVADLEVGRVVHQLAVNKQIDVRNTMLHGPTMQPRSRNRKQRPTAAEPSTAAKSESGQINRVMEVVERKIAARQADIESKRHKWAVLMGLEQEGPPVGASAVAPGLLGPGLDTGEDSDEDMPLIPGLPSMFTHLTGPSAGGRTHSGTEATEVTVQGTGEIELSSKQQNQAPKRKRGASRPPLPPKRGRKAASSDSDDSDNNGRRGASDDWDIIAARERSAMMATLAAHASAEDEDYDAEGAEGSPGGAFYGLEATMAALAEDEGI